MLVDLNREAALETQSLIENEGGTCAVIRADVSDSRDCASIVEQYLKNFGLLDILHNNVGIEESGGLEDTSVALKGRFGVFLERTSHPW